MAGRFLLRRAETAQARSRAQMAVTDERVARLVALCTALADRMEALPPADWQRAPDRRERILVLRRTAAEGTLALRRRAADDPQDRSQTGS